MLDNQLIKNNWPRIKSKLLTHWNKLSEADVERTHGNMDLLENLIQKYYGEAEGFENDYDNLCKSIIYPHPSSYISTDSITASSKSAMHSMRSIENELIESSMDKDRDDMYLMGPNGVTRKAEIPGINQSPSNDFSIDDIHNSHPDGFNNINRYKTTEFSDPGHEIEEEVLKTDLMGLEATDAQTALMKEYESPRKSRKKSKSLKHKKIITSSASDEIKPYQVPRTKVKDITSRRSNSSANTTSQSAPNIIRD